MKRVPPGAPASVDDDGQILQEQLKEAIMDLVEHMGGDAFYVELSSSEDDESLYLVFGSGSLIKRFAGALPDDSLPGDPARIH